MPGPWKPSVEGFCRIVGHCLGHLWCLPTPPVVILITWSNREFGVFCISKRSGSGTYTGQDYLKFRSCIWVFKDWNFSELSLSLIIFSHKMFSLLLFFSLSCPFHLTRKWDDYSRSQKSLASLPSLSSIMAWVYVLVYSMLDAATTQKDQHLQAFQK